MRNSLFFICSLLLVIASASVIAQPEEDKQPVKPQQLKDDCPPGGKTRAPVTARDWRYLLAGSRLLLREFVDGRRLEESLDFCSDGTVYNRMLSADSKHNDAAFSYGVSTQYVSGMWTVIEVDGANQLLLRKRDNQERRMLIEDRNGATFLDGRRYFLLENRRCR